MVIILKFRERSSIKKSCSTIQESGIVCGFTSQNSPIIAHLPGFHVQRELVSG